MSDCGYYFCLHVFIHLCMQVHTCMNEVNEKSHGNKTGSIFTELFIENAQAKISKVTNEKRVVSFGSILTFMRLAMMVRILFLPSSLNAMMMKWLSKTPSHPCQGIVSKKQH